MKKQEAAIFSVISNFILIILKLTIGIYINSVSVISEGIHSSIDLLASVISFFSIKKASEKEDAEHPFGHGKYENVSGFFEAVLILFTGIIMIYEAISKLILGNTIKSLYSGMFVMALSCILNLAVALYILSVSKKSNSIALSSDGYHILTDSLTSFTVLIGLFLVRITGLKFIDSISALFVSVLIIKTSFVLIKNSLKDLVDSSLSKNELEKIIRILKRYPEIKSFHKLRTRKSGETFEINMHLLFDSNKSLLEVHEVCNCIESELDRVFLISNTTIHAEPFITKENKVYVLDSNKSYK
ncbi:cation diffusion facilitator family transporter [Clostridium acidisoli DSM 12555]|uniref:Cation diffusion facilitator family transporter n=1 Tax=Clostridium acidisoli DSM 12555 TaxID=1121291 RepID=A0A1W1X7M6_9CLOT|nr:cation diffusion facilitator family transporter [Clostridium acidisoli]SMC19929.1 cation diffusion facilitator family transporter [Clostridium acidisoli DSM 12555]